MRIKKSQKSVLVVLLVVLCIINWRCKENVSLSPNLVPAIDNVNTFFTDSITVLSNTEYQDSLFTGGIKSGTNRSADNLFFHAIGCMNFDPVFGKTVAASYFTVVPPVNDFKFSGRNQIIDSVIVAVPYKSSYADSFGTSQMQHFSLYQTDSLYSKDSAYFENIQVAKSTNSISQKSFSFYKAYIDSPVVNGKRERPQLRFKLPTWYADSLLADTATIYKTPVTFMKWNKGFYIAPDSNIGNTIGYFNTYNARMIVYYRDTNSTTGKLDTNTAIFPFEPTNCTRFNTITRNYNNSTAKPFINTGSALGDTITFVQGTPGLSTVIKFPYIDSFKLAAINKAELVITCVPDFTTQYDTTVYGLPFRLEVLKEKNGTDKLLDDYINFSLGGSITNGVSYVDGKKQIVTINGTKYVQYKFVITSTIQKAILNKDSKFRIKLNSSNTGLPIIGRAIFYGSKSVRTDLKPKLNVIFTKIN